MSEEEIEILIFELRDLRGAKEQVKRESGIEIRGIFEK